MSAIKDVVIPVVRDLVKSVLAGVLGSAGPAVTSNVINGIDNVINGINNVVNTG